jgi:RNA polymerase subunit RPABC4/transcription elongation factor Spt4
LLPILAEQNEACRLTSSYPYALKENAMATDEWHYSKGDEKRGPISSADLKQLAASEELSPDDLVWKQDWPEWRPASSIKGLFVRSSPPPPPRQASPSTPALPSAIAPRSEDEKFCESCGKAINAAAVICPHCGVKQKTAGIAGFFRKQTTAIKSKIAVARTAIDEEMHLETGISTPHKIVAVVVAACAGWTGVTGLGSIIAGRSKAGFAMLGLPLLLGVLTVGCMVATFFSAIASIFVVGIPFFIVFGTLLTVLLPLFATTFIGFYIADVMICIKAK